MDAIFGQQLRLDEHVMAGFGDAVPKVHVVGGPKLGTISAEGLDHVFAENRGWVMEADRQVIFC